MNHYHVHFAYTHQSSVTRNTYNHGGPWWNLLDAEDSARQAKEVARLGGERVRFWVSDPCGCPDPVYK